MVAALCIPAALFAQVRTDTTRTAPPDSTVQRIAPVVVTGAPAPAAIGGSSAVVLAPGELTTPPAPSLEQALREMPFVLVRQNSRGEVELSVRGSDSRQAAVLVDGLPLSLGWDHRTDPSLVPLTGARRLTLVRGLATLLVGPNVLGGVIEVDVAGGEHGFAPSGELTPELALASGIDHTAARVLSGSGALPLRLGAGTLILRGGAAYHARDGLELGRDVQPGGAGAESPGEGTDPGQPEDPHLRTNSDLRQVDGFASARYETPRGTFAGLTSTAYRAERGVPPELHLEEPRLWRYPDLSRVIAILSAGSGRRATPWGRGALEISAGVNDGDVAIESFADRSYGVPIGRESGDERTLSARVHATHTLPGGGELRAAVTHADVRYDERIDEDPASRYRQRLSSIGTEAQWLLFSRALITGGVVHDVASTPETGGRPSVGTLARTGWRLGATSFAFDHTVRVHATVSDRARFPALRELYSGALDRFEPNPALRPERLLGAEFGATVLGGAPEAAGISLQSVIFHHRLRDAVVRVSTPEGRFRRINRDEIRSTGVELLATWTPVGGVGSGRLDGLSLTADLLVQRVRVIDPPLTNGTTERRAEHQPELRAAIDLTLPLPLDIRAMSTLRYAGRQYCVHPDLGRQVALAAQAGGDVAITRTWSPGAGLLRRVRAVLALENITDASIYDQCGLPRPGRTLRAAIELR